MLKIPDSLELDVAAPLLCAGVTTYAPLTRWQVGPGTTLGIAGLGGLGHLAVKLGKALGADRVVALTTTAEKAEGARGVGADDAILMSDEDQVNEAEASLDVILSTIPTST